MAVNMLSIIITTYNRPDALNAVLQGFAAQSKKNFELIIADDGSGDTTKKLIKQWQKQLPIQHVWHEDCGFRAAGIRNKAVVKCQYDYIVFIDGDCIPRPNFIEQHQRLVEQGFFVAGNRVLISQMATQYYLSTGEPIHQWDLQQYRQAVKQKQLKRSFPLYVLPGQQWRKYISQRWQGVRTCNLGVWKQDILAINGFDESFTGWGHEDADLAVRLLRSGIKRKDGRFATTVLHLWHPENDRSQLTKNEKRLSDILHCQRLRALQGLNQYH